MNNLRMEKLAQLRGIVKTAFGEDEVAAAIEQIRAAKTLQELEALKAKAEADLRKVFLSPAQIASMQAAYEMKKSQLEVASRGATTPAPQAPGGAATSFDDQFADLALKALKSLEDRAGSLDVAFSSTDPAGVESAANMLSEEMNKHLSNAKFNLDQQSKFSLLEGRTISCDGQNFKRLVREPGLVTLLQNSIRDAHKTAEPQATRRTSGGSSGKGSSDKTAVIKKELWSTTVSDSAYKYTISNDGKSFNWVGADKSGVHKQGDSNWGKMVDNLNLMTPTGQKRDTNPAVNPTSATPETTAAPASPAATGLDQSLVQKVAAVLQKAASNPLNIRSGGDEMNQIKSLVRDIGGVQNLAAVIVLKVGTILTTLSSVKVDDINAARTKDLAVNRGGKFSGDVGIILRQVNELFKSGNKSPGSIAALGRTITQSPAPVAPVTPATPVAPVTQPVTPVTPPATKASASLDKKFVKAATLRRMRIRSQMEAAVDSSAQMGRSRVF